MRSLGNRSTPSEKTKTARPLARTRSEMRLQSKRSRCFPERRRRPTVSAEVSVPKSGLSRDTTHEQKSAVRNAKRNELFFDASQRQTDV